MKYNKEKMKNNEFLNNTLDDMPDDIVQNNSQCSWWPDILRVSQRAAIAAAALVGHGDEWAADQVAVTAMRDELNRLPGVFTVVIGEGERDAAPMLYIGEQLGQGVGDAGNAASAGFTEGGERALASVRRSWDVAVDPLEGTTLCAKGMPGAMTAIAVAESGGLIKAPDAYMLKVAFGPGVIRDEEEIDLEQPLSVIIAMVAAARGKEVGEVRVAVLDRPRHGEIIRQIRAAGARAIIYQDGDLAACIATCLPWSGIDLYVGVGGAPEGVIAAAAVKVLGGKMVGKLAAAVDESTGAGADGAAVAAIKCGFVFADKVYRVDDLVPAKEVVVALSGVTDGYLLNGVKMLGAGSCRVCSLVFGGGAGKKMLRIEEDFNNYLK